MKNSLMIALLIISFASCKKDDTQVNNSYDFSEGVFIANEVNFQSANSSVSYYNPENQSVLTDAFSHVNNRSLGDICQSITKINNKIYIVVNNSGKIEICNPVTFASISTISGFTSPRYMCAV